MVRQLFVCEICKNTIAMEQNGVITIKHRGRTIRSRGVMWVTCEKCQTENRIEVSHEKSVC